MAREVSIAASRTMVAGAAANFQQQKTKQRPRAVLSVHRLNLNWWHRFTQACSVQ
jgi:hypothetical protein